MTVIGTHHQQVAEKKQKVDSRDSVMHNENSVCLLLKRKKLVNERR